MVSGPVTFSLLVVLLAVGTIEVIIFGNIVPPIPTNNSGLRNN